MELRNILKLIGTTLERAVLATTTPAKEAELGWNASTKRIIYYNGSSVIEIDPSGGGSLPSSVVENESGNAENIIEFTAPKVYNNASGKIKCDITGAAAYGMTQFVIHTSALPLTIESGDDYECRILSSSEYESDGTTTNLVMLSYNGTFEVSGKRIINVSVIPLSVKPSIGSVTISTPSLNIPVIANYSPPANEQGSLFYFRRASNEAMTSGVQWWNGTSWQLTKVGISVNSYTPTTALSDESKWIDVEVRVGVLRNNIIELASDTEISTPLQVGAALNNTPLEAEAIFISGEEVPSGTRGPVAISSQPEASGSSGIILPDPGDVAIFTFSATAKTYNRIEVDVRIGDAVTPDNYKNAYTFIINNDPVTFVHDGSSTSTTDIGGAHYGKLVAENVTLLANNTIRASCSLQFGFIDKFNIVG